MKPGKLSVDGEIYIPIVLLIHTKNPDGSPALMKHITEDQTIDLAGGEEFMIAYAPAKMIKKNPVSRPISIPVRKPITLVADEDIDAGSSIYICLKIPVGADINDYLDNGMMYRAFNKRDSVDFRCIGMMTQSVLKGVELVQGKLSKWYPKTGHCP